jgi:putative NADPH-quinone reductase
MGKRILLVQGHPDSGQAHFIHALADPYARGAATGGHQVARVDVASLDCPLLRSKADWDHSEVRKAVLRTAPARGSCLAARA